LKKRIEGLAYHKGYPWLVGSHRPKRSKPEAESATKNFAHLARVSSDGNRYLLARIPPVKRKGIYTLAKEVEEHGQKRSAAQLRCSTTTSELTHALHEDVHLQHFFSLPGKDNSFDIKGLAVARDRIFSMGEEKSRVSMHTSCRESQGKPGSGDGSLPVCEAPWRRSDTAHAPPVSAGGALDLRRGEL
jgi:hypothetical protein